MTTHACTYFFKILQASSNICIVPTCAILSKCRGVKDIKYDIPVCHEGHKGHAGHAFICISLNFSTFFCISLHFNAFLCNLLAFSAFYTLYILQQFYGAYRSHMYAIFMKREINIFVPKYFCVFAKKSIIYI